MDPGKAISEFEPLIKKTVNQYRGAGIPPELLRVEAETIVANAAKQSSNDDTLPAYIKANMMKMHRIVNNASEVYVPEHRVDLLGKYMRTKEEQEDQLGREPTIEEMADELKVSVREVGRLSQEAGKSLVHMDNLPDMGIDELPSSFAQNNHGNVLELIWEKVPSEKDKQVLEHAFGLHGTKEKKTNKEIAEELGISQTSVRKAKDKIIGTIGELY